MRLAPILNRIPEVFAVPIDRGSVVLMASDGVFSPLHDTNSLEGSRELLSIVDGGGNADTIVADAIRRETRDNVTVIVCKIS